MTRVTNNYGTRCLMARRLVEAGVRFVQVFPPLKPSFQPWDSHNNLKAELESICGQTDRPAAALVTDLKVAGAARGDDRDLDRRIRPIARHAKREWTRPQPQWIRPVPRGRRLQEAATSTAPATSLATRRSADPVSVPDLHATLLHQLGIDHNRLVFTERGIEETPTDAKVSGAKVVKEIIWRERQLSGIWTWVICL